MFNKFNLKQKPPKERFLLILGLVTFICFFGLGLMLMFWNRLPLNMGSTQRYLYGSVVIVYSIIRFSRLFTQR